MEATKHRLIAIRFPDGLPETEPLVIIRQVVFDQAREALQTAREALVNTGFCCGDNCIDEIDQALSAMEATP